MIVLIPSTFWLAWLMMGGILCFCCK
jgi:hypothetical protein